MVNLPCFKRNKDERSEKWMRESGMVMLEWHSSVMLTFWLEISKCKTLLWECQMERVAMPNFYFGVSDGFWL